VTRRGVLTGLAGAAALISVVTVVSRLLGFVRTLVFGRAVGYAEVGDAYTLANTLPNVLFEVAAGGALAGALIPVIAGPLARGMREDVSRIASAMLGWALGALSVLALLLAALAEPVAALLVHEAGDSRDLVVFFVRVFAVQVPLYGLAVVLSGVLQAQRRFFWPAFVPVLSSLVVIGVYAGYGRLVGLGSATVPGAAALPEGAAALLAWGTTAGVAVMGLPLLVPVARSGVRLRPTLRFPEGVGARARGLALAGVGALVAQQLAVLVTLWLAGRYGTDGAVSGYQSMVQTVYMLPYAVLSVPLATSTFPRLAERAARPDRAGYAPLAALTTRAVLMSSAVGAAVLVAVAPAATTVFSVVGRGDAEVIATLSDALTLMAPGLLGLGLIFHVSRALYALERGRLAVLATSLGWATVVVASWAACLLVVPSGGSGPATLRALAAGNTIGMLVAGVALVLVLRRAAGPAAVAGLTRTLGVLLLGGALAAVAGRWTVDAVERMAGGSVAGAVAAAAGGGALVLAVVLALVWALDRGTLTGLLRRGGGAGPAGTPPQTPRTAQPVRTTTDGTEDAR
jgi:putative peptidoglycan lipid II flippase